MDRYITTKGLFVRAVGSDSFVLEDVFGICSMPFYAENIKTASIKANELGRVRVLCHESVFDPMSGIELFRWFELEKYYVAKLADHFRYWQVGRQSVRTFDKLSNALPIAYFDLGFGEGSRDTLEEIDKKVNVAAKAGKVPFTKYYLAIRLSHMQLERICSDLMSLMHRAIQAFVDLLAIQRLTIKQEYWSAEHLNAPEIIHTGPKSYKAATNTTMCVISLCTSLDISSKLLHFLNFCSRPTMRFRNAQGKNFSDLPNMKPNTLPADLISKIVDRGNNGDRLSSLIQLRHDLIHSTAALEMEKIYIGYQTGEINELPLHYSYMPWRDCSENGQPLRYLGREYFTSQRIDIEWQLLTWIRAVVDYHLFVGERLYEFMMSNTVDDVGVRLSTD